jgi:copper transport protein
VRGPPISSAVLRAVLLPALVGALLALATGPAAAHASLVETVPADGQTLDRIPEQIALTFNDPVTVAAGAVRIYDSTGERVDDGASQVPDGAPETVTVPLAGDLAEGTYVVTWRVTSADGHPVRGAFTFSVGVETGVDDTIMSQLFAEGGDRWIALAATLLRGLTYIATLLAAGAVVFLLQVAGPSPGRRLSQVAIAAAAVGILTTAVGMPLQAALTSGEGLLAALRPGTLVGTVGSFFLLSSATRLAGLAALAVLLLRGGGRWVARGALVTAAIALGSFLLSGHTVVTEPRWLVVSADAVHLAAGATWFGGLVLLAISLRERRSADDPVGGAELVARFSGIATVAIVAVVLAGSALAWAEVRALRALTSTAYGWTLLVKVALVAVVAAIGAYNHRHLVPAINATRGHGGEDDADGVAPPADGAAAGPEGGAADGAAVGIGAGRETTSAVAVPEQAGAEPRPGSRDAAGPGAEDRSREPDGRDAIAVGQHPGAESQRSTTGAAWDRLRRTVRLEVIGICAVLLVTGSLVYVQPAREAAGVTGDFSVYEAMGDAHELNLVVTPNRAGRNEIHLYVLETETFRPVQQLGGAEMALELQPPGEDAPLVRTPSGAGPGHWILTGDELAFPGTWEVTAILRLSEFEELRASVDVPVNP